MLKIKKVVATVWYNKKNMHDLRRVFPDAEFCYVDFFDKEKLEKEVKDADVAILMGDVDPCLLGENTLKWIHCDHAGGMKRHCPDVHGIVTEQRLQSGLEFIRRLVGERDSEN